jgi:hypothetical protein
MKQQDALESFDLSAAFRKRLNGIIFGGQREY